MNDCVILSFEVIAKLAFCEKSGDRRQNSELNLNSNFTMPAMDNLTLDYI